MFEKIQSWRNQLDVKCVIISYMKIGKLKFDNDLFLAPMAGVTDVGFREVAALSGAACTYTEMVSSAALVHSSHRTHKLLLTTPAEKIKAVQIFGNNPEDMAESIKFFDGFDIVDINMGCPAPKIVNNGDGCALMKNPVLASKIIESCVKVADRPVTVKFRKGFASDTAVDFARMCEDSGASAIAIHGRTRGQMYSGFVDYDVIAKVKAAVNIPVIGNGDVRDKETLESMRATGVDGVMIGRSTLGKPWLFADLLDKELEMKHIEYVKLHINRLKMHFSDAFLVKYLRKHMLWYVSGRQIPSEIKMKLALLTNIDEGIEILANYLS